MKDKLILLSPKLIRQLGFGDEHTQALADTGLLWRTVRHLDLFLEQWGSVLGYNARLLTSFRLGLDLYSSVKFDKNWDVIDLVFHEGTSFSMKWKSNYLVSMTMKGLAHDRTVYAAYLSSIPRPRLVDMFWIWKTGQAFHRGYGSEDADFTEVHSAFRCPEDPSILDDAARFIALSRINHIERCSEHAYAVRPYDSTTSRFTALFPSTSEEVYTYTHAVNVSSDDDLDKLYR